jgi:RNA polymerase alpha subunit
MKSDEDRVNVFSQLEKQVAVSILKGMPLSKCSYVHGITKLKCQTVVNTYCLKSNRDLYDTLRWNPFDPVAPISELRKHAQHFIDGVVSLEKVTIQSSIWALPGVPIRILNALWKSRITTIEDILAYDQRDLLRLRNVGKGGFRKLLASLGRYGFINDS